MGDKSHGKHMDPIETIDAIFDLLANRLASMDVVERQKALATARKSVKYVALYQHVLDYTVVECDLENILTSS